MMQVFIFDVRFKTQCIEFWFLSWATSSLLSWPWLVPTIPHKTHKKFYKINGMKSFCLHRRDKTAVARFYSIKFRLHEHYKIMEVMQDKIMMAIIRSKLANWNSKSHQSKIEVLHSFQVYEPWRDNQNEAFLLTNLQNPSAVYEEANNKHYTTFQKQLSRLSKLSCYQKITWVHSSFSILRTNSFFSGILFRLMFSDCKCIFANNLFIWWILYLKLGWLLAYLYNSNVQLSKFSPMLSQCIREA